MASSEINKNGANDDSDLPKSDFIRDRIQQDLSNEKNEGKVTTRFPPEPNGYLHIGHAKAICLSFGVANEFENARCHLRFDDSNPTKEKTEYVNSIKEDVRWLGFDWGSNLFFASDYFDKLYAYGVHLIKKGKAYVCDLSAEQVREYRGTPTIPGKHSPNRDRSVEENLELFEKMKQGAYVDGAKTLRAKIDMSSPNIHMRDPALYRIRNVEHHRTGNNWCIYPMYDFTHCLSDSIEKITHSLCTLEFEVHRPLYDWVLDECEVETHPQQIEFAKLHLSYSILSKRNLLSLIEEGVVSGWDDPRMPTLSGYRRRGYTPESIRSFCDRIGVTKYDGMTDIALLEFSIRQDLNKRAVRRMAVLNPLKLIIDNYPVDQVEEVDAVNNPEDPDTGTRKVNFSRELFIEKTDFMEDPPKKFFRLGPDREVRLKYGYIIKCVSFEKDATSGEVTAIHCTYDPDSKSGSGTTTRKVKAAIHWVSAAHAKTAEVRLYDRLMTVEDPLADKEKDWKEFLNLNSVEVLTDCKVEPSAAELEVGKSMQFERTGYFCADAKDSSPDHLVFNRTVPLRDSWAKKNKPNK